MSNGTTGAPKVTPQRLPEAGGEARRRGGPPWMAAAMPAEKAMTFVPSAKRLLGRLRPHRVTLIVVVALALVSVTLSVLGPELLGRATDVIFTGYLGSRLPAGVPLDRVIAAARARGDGNYADLLARAHVQSRRRHRFRRPPHRARVGNRRLCGRERPRLPAGRAAHPHREPDCAAAAHRRGGQARPAAAALRRRPAARRAAQPGHQRHRQHHAEPAADDQPVADLAAHGHRCRRDDVRHLAPAGCHRARDDPSDDVRHEDDRAPLATQVHRAVEGDGAPERSYRGSVLGPRDREGVRPATRERRDLRQDQRRAVRG